MPPPPQAAGLGAGGGSSPQGAALRPRPAGWRGGGVGYAGGGGRGSIGGVGVWRKSCIILVLKLALDHLGLGATAGAHNPLDILILGGHDGLQLRREGVRLHFGVCFHHRALVLKCSCIHAVLQI